ncbi:hypothetical protein NMG60_11005863 [Bertholletia excelsa]
MFPSQGNGNIDPFSFSYSSPYDIFIPMPKQEESYPSSFIDLPSHFEDDLLFQHLNDLFTPQVSTTTAQEAITEDSIGDHRMVQAVIPKKRTSKRDRHTKIDTAQGQRDRRMRLSLEVAREFFDLQDTLGYDKPSKTIKWLLGKSNAAIRELTGGLPLVNVKATGSNESSPSDQSTVGSCPTVKAREKKNRAARKSVLSPVDKETREKARARARERAKDKKILVHGSKESVLEEALNDHHMNPFENGKDLGQQSFPIKANWFLEVEEPGSSTIFDYDQHNPEISLANQFTEF